MVDLTDTGVSDLGELERGAPTALHDQISSLMRARILSGEWPAHMKLPAEPELARVLNVARGTVRRAIRTLLDQGLLVQTRGKGTFVRSRLLEQNFAQELVGTAESLDREGVAYTTQVLAWRLEPAQGPIRAHLGLEEDNPTVLAIRRTRSVEGRVVYLLDNYLPAALCPGLDPRVLTERSLFAVLEQDYGVTVDSVRRTFAAQVATPEVATTMGLDPASAVIYLEQIAYGRSGAAVEYSDVWMRGDRVRISSWLRRATPGAQPSPASRVPR